MFLDRKRLAGVASALLVGVVAAIATLAWSTAENGSATAASTRSQSGHVTNYAVLTAPPAQGASPFVNASRLAPGIESAPVHVVGIGRDKYSVAATSDMVCVDSYLADSASSTGGCAPVAAVEADGFFTGSHAAPNTRATPGETSITGLVPDGVKTVEITLANGATTNLDVRSNIIARTFASEPVTARYVRSDGRPVVAKLTER